MKKGTRGIAAIVIAGAVAIATALPAAAWYYRYFGYPGDGKYLSTTLSEVSCQALAETSGYSGQPGLVKTTKTSGGSTCSVRVNYGLWTGSSVWWNITKTGKVSVYYAPSETWYISQHGVDS